MSEKPKFTDLLRSTGRLTRHDDEIKPGDVVSVEAFEATPMLLELLGIMFDMTSQEATDRIVEAFKRAADTDRPPVQEGRQGDQETLGVKEEG